MTGIRRAYMGEVLKQVWLNSINVVSELLDKQVNEQKEFEKHFQSLCELLQAHVKVGDEMKEEKMTGT